MIFDRLFTRRPDGRAGDILPPPDPSYTPEVMEANLAERKAARPARRAAAMRGRT